jgi:hypothetical protein
LANQQATATQVANLIGFADQIGNNVCQLHCNTTTVELNQEFRYFDFATPWGSLCCIPKSMFCTPKRHVGACQTSAVLARLAPRIVLASQVPAGSRNDASYRSDLHGAVWLMQEECPVFSEGHDRHSVLQAAAMAARWWEPARDALDTMVLNAAALHELEPYSHVDYMPFDATVKVRRSCPAARPPPMPFPSCAVRVPSEICASWQGPSSFSAGCDARDHCSRRGGATRK